MTSLFIFFGAAVSLIAALVGIGVYDRVVVGPALRRLEGLVALHDEAIGGAGAGAASGRIEVLERKLGVLDGQQGRQERRLVELERVAHIDLSLAGFVRFNAFEDVGSDLSYALALLNREGNGIVLSSLYSRSDTRTYGKEVRSFTPAVGASEEELRAIARAREVSSSAQTQGKVLH